MEPEVRAFLLMIVQSISMVMLFMLVHMTFGIYYGYGFFEDKPTLANYIYGAIFLTSFFFLIRYLKKKWKGWKEPGEGDENF